MRFGVFVFWRGDVSGLFICGSIQFDLIRGRPSYLTARTKTKTGAYHRDTSCDASTFIANQPQQPQKGIPAATQVQEGAAGDEKDTEAYKMKRAQFSLQVGFLRVGVLGLGLVWMGRSTGASSCVVYTYIYMYVTTLHTGPPPARHGDQGPAPRRLHPLLLHRLLP